MTITDRGGRRIMRFIGGALGLLALAALTGGCSEKGATQPGDGPIGIPDTVRALVAVAWADTAEIPGYGITRAMSVAVFDRTSANSFVLWREEPSGGYRRVKDYLGVTTAHFLAQGGEYLRFYDVPNAPPPNPLRYLVQGGISGTFGPTSALSDTAVVFTTGDTLPLPPRDLVTVLPVDSASADSFPRLVWQQVAGAAGYVLQIYQPRRDVKDSDVFPEARSQPYYEKSKTFYLAWVPANPAIPPGSNVNFILGLNPAVVFESRLPMLALQFYRWRVAAVDANGRMISVPEGFVRTFIFGTELRTIRAGFEVYFAVRPPP
jgi:hypothetical protein